MSSNKKNEPSAPTELVWLESVADQDRQAKVEVESEEFFFEELDGPAQQDQGKFALICESLGVKAKNHLSDDAAKKEKRSFWIPIESRDIAHVYGKSRAFLAELNADRANCEVDLVYRPLRIRIRTFTEAYARKVHARLRYRLANARRHHDQSNSRPDVVEKQGIIETAEQDEETWDGQDWAPVIFRKNTKGKQKSLPVIALPLLYSDNETPREPIGSKVLENSQRKRALAKGKAKQVSWNLKS